MPDVQVNGVRLAVTEQGDGPPLVLVHGLGGDGGGIWDASPGACRRLPRRRVRPARVGRQRGAAGPYTIDVLVDDLAALVDELGLGRRSH